MRAVRTIGALIATACGLAGQTASPLGIFVTNPQTSTYQALASDFTACKVIPVASGTFTITLVASTSQPPTGQCLDVINYGSGVITVAASGQNINGSATSQTLAAGSASAPTGIRIVSDGTNYFAQAFAAGGGGSSAFSAITTGTNTAALLIGTGGSLGVTGTGTIAATSVTGLSVTGGKTLTVSNSLTFAGADSTTMTFPTTTATIARTDAAQTFTGHNTFEGVTSTGATGTGNFVFSSSPTFTGTVTMGTLQGVSGSQLGLSGNFTSQAGSNGIVLKNNGSRTATSGAGIHTQLLVTYAPTSGSGTFSILQNDATVNQTSTASGITRGFYENPTCTSCYDYRGWETASGVTINLLSNTPTSYAQVYLNPWTYAGASSRTPANTATLRIGGAPIDGTNVTTGNKMGVWLEGGSARFDGILGCLHGTNLYCGVATLASGTVTVSTTAVAALAATGAAGQAISLTLQSCSSCGTLSIGTVTGGTSFVINSSNGADASLVFWRINQVY